MPQIPEIGNIPGVKDVWSLLAFLTSPKEYQLRMDQLKKAYEDLHAIVAAVGQVEALDRIVAQASSDRTMAAEALRNAKAEADRLVLATQKDREVARASVQQAEDHARALVHAAEGRLKTREADAARTMSEGTQALEKARLLMGEAQSLHVEAVAIKAEFDRRLDALKQKQAELASV